MHWQSGCINCAPHQPIIYETQTMERVCVLIMRVSERGMTGTLETQLLMEGLLEGHMLWDCYVIV